MVFLIKGTIPVKNFDLFLIRSKTCTFCRSKTCTFQRVPCKRKAGPCKFLSVQKLLRTSVNGVANLDVKHSSWARGRGLRGCGDGGGGLSADLPCYCPELHGSYPAVPGTLLQPGGEGSGGVVWWGGLSADPPSYCPELCMVVIQQFLVLCHSRGGEGSGGVVWWERGAQCRPTLLLSRVAW